MPWHLPPGSAAMGPGFVCFGGFYLLKKAASAVKLPWCGETSTGWQLDNWR